MSRDELLNECAMTVKPFLWGGGNNMPYKGDMLGWNEYQLRRTELINEPDDIEAPEWARWKAQDSDGEWYWYDANPEIDDVFENWDMGDEGECYEFSRIGEIPAGHDWRETLMPVNQDAQQDAARLDAQLEEAIMKQPRYQDAQGEDWIDEFARTATIDEFRGAMRFTIGKYNRRVGKKDDVLKEVTKMRDYCQRWEEYEKGVKG